jgi:hypothetical protein
MTSKQCLNKLIGCKPILTPCDEIHFWSLQIKEHMKFIFLGLAGECDNIKKFKKMAILLEYLWHDVHHYTFNQNDILKILPRKLVALARFVELYYDN